MKPNQAVCALLDALQEAEIPHMVTGGLATNAHGIARSTDDADVVVQVDGSGLDRLASTLPSELQIGEQLSFEAITGSRRVIVTLRNHPFIIELFFLGSDPHHQERFRRRIHRYLPDLNREAWLATAEDMIIQKIRWNRDKDRDDARNILAVQSDTLDFDYIEGWCRIHGTHSRLEELRRSIPPV